MSSPAERYAAARRRGKHPTLSDFTAELGFTLDPFQVEACEALEEGSGVLVCAPTGAGKTVVGEFAVHKALAEGRKAFYTTPIKALSNQKYADLVGNRVFDLFSLRPAAHAGEAELTPRGASTRERGASVVDPELVRFVREQERRVDSWDTGPGRSRAGSGYRMRWRPPARSDVVERLDRAGLLPAITFVFSRNGCDAAVAQCLHSGLRLTSEEERAEIAQVIDERTGSLPDEDLHVLGFW